jgi:NAD(P)-dependent dehydrogenase (short-subunit alcohol dehydrogenase family)
MTDPGPSDHDFPANGIAVVAGATGGIGEALCEVLENSCNFQNVVRLSRKSDPALELTSERSVIECADFCKGLGNPIRLVVDATGFLHGEGFSPEKSWRELNPEHMAAAFDYNVVGPALLMKHFLPLLASPGKSVFTTLSARVGSIGDNRLGGWYSYRASKAALNQIMKCASIELSRSNRDAICISQHPGTVATKLSAPFAKTGLRIQSPHDAAESLWSVIQALTPCQTGRFLDFTGKEIEW